MKRQRGVTVVFVLLSLVSLIGFAALGVDAGLIYAARGALQRTADSAALSAARALASCNSGAAERTVALAAAQDAAATNPVVGRLLALDGADVTFGRATGTNRDFVAGNTNPDSVKVVLHEDTTRNGPLPLTIGAVLGRASAALDASAVATRDRRVVGFKEPPGTRGDVMPFAAASGAIGLVGTRAHFFDGSTGPGNFGLIDLGPSGFTLTAHSSDPTIVAQITNGYTGTLQLDPVAGTQTSGRTGSLGGSIAAALNGRIGDVVILATYGAPPTGNGTNLTYLVTGFAAVRIESVTVTGPPSARGIVGTVVALAEDRAITSAGAPENCLISRIQLTR